MKKIILLLFLLPFAGLATNPSIPRPDHVVIVVFENQSKQVVLGCEFAPYINKLLTDSNTAFFTQSYGLVHPSQPNYIMLFSGSSHGVKDDSLIKNTPFKTPNLGASLLAKGLTFAGYSEDMPYTGFTYEKEGLYARKHNPWVNWQDAEENGIPASCNKTYDDFPSDFNKLPTVSFVVPNLEHDMHDPPNSYLAIKRGDKWLEKNLKEYVKWAKTHNSLLIVTFDEDDNHNFQNIPTLFIGEMVQHGFYDQKINHYDVLRTIEDMYGLDYLGHSKEATPIQGIWRNNSITKN